MKTRTLALIGGGTGGHVYPAVAIAEAWKARGEGYAVHFVGSADGLEARVVPVRGHPFTAIQARRLKNAGVIERGRSLIAMPQAISRGGQIIKQIDPDVILGVGGYVSGPVVLAGALAGRPVAIAEQNAVPGLTNRLLARAARRIYTAFPEAEARLPAAKIKLLGNPVRADILAAAERRGPPTGRRILVIGGSQGALALNRDLPEILATVGAEMPDLHVEHLTGPGRRAEAEDRYEAAGFKAVEIHEYLDDMADALSRADLIIARAGATTVAELAVMGRPSVLIPFPYAADDHQAANARSLVDAGGALMIREQDMAAEMRGALRQLLRDGDRLREMAERARGRGRPSAAADIAADLDALADAQGRRRR